jgi:hypothetical protein
MKPKLLHPVPAVAAAVGLVIVGLTAYSPSRAALLIERDGQKIFVPVRLG